MPETQYHKRLGILAILLAAVLWGTTGTAAFFIRDTVAGMTIGASTMFGGGILLFLLSSKKAIQIIRTQSPWLLLCGSIAIAIYPLSFYSGMSIAGVALGNITAIASAPIFAAFIEKIFTQKKLDFTWLCVSTLIISGIILMIIGNGKFRSADKSPHESYFLGIVLALIAGFTYALYTFISHYLMQRTYNSTATMGALFGLGAIFLLPVLLLTGSHLLTYRAIPIVLYLILVPMFIAYLLFGYGLKYISATKATILTLVEPVISVILGVFLTHDQLRWYGWLGAIITLIGMSIPEDFSFLRKFLSHTS